MDVAEFRKFAGAAVDYIADYLENIRDRLVLTLPYIFLRILVWVLFKRYYYVILIREFAVLGYLTILFQLEELYNR